MGVFSRLGVFAVLGFATCIGATGCGSPGGSLEPDLDTHAPHGSRATPLTVPLSTVPADIIDRARRYLADGRVAGDWSSPVLSDTAYPLWLDDGDSPAYFELAVTDGSRPAGFLRLATGEHDFPVTAHASEGVAPAASLLEAANRQGLEARRYWLSGHTIVAEGLEGTIDALVDAAGRVRVASDEPALVGVRVASTVRGALMGAGRGESPADVDAASEVRDAWTVERSLTGTNSDVRICERCPTPGQTPTGPHWIDYRVRADTTDFNALTPQYKQLRPYESTNPNPCHSGCGATAFQIMLGWADTQPEIGRPASEFTTDGMRGLLPGRAARNAAERSPPIIYDAQVMAIHRAVGTICLGDQGATMPWDMANFQANFLDANHFPIRMVQHTNPLLVGEPGIRDVAINSIMYRGVPAIVGMADLVSGPDGKYHYAVADAVRVHYGGNPKEIHFNWGQGGAGNQWLTMSGAAYAVEFFAR